MTRERSGSTRRAKVPSAKGAWHRKLRLRSDYVRRTRGRAIITELSRGTSSGAGQRRDYHSPLTSLLIRNNHRTRSSACAHAFGESVNIHEYQAKEIFRKYGIPIPPGEVATTPERSGGNRPKVRRHGRREGAGSRRRTRQGRRSQARQDSRGSTRGRREDPQAHHQGSAGAEGSCHAGRRHRDRSVCRG